MTENDAYSLAFDVLAEQYAATPTKTLRQESEALSRDWHIPLAQAVAIVTVARQEKCSYPAARELLKRWEAVVPHEADGQPDRYMADRTGREHDDLGKFAKKRSVSSRMSDSPGKALGAMNSPTVRWHGVSEKETKARIEALKSVPRKTLQRVRDDFNEAYNQEEQRIGFAREDLEKHPPVEYDPADIKGWSVKDQRHRHVKEILEYHEAAAQEWAARIAALDEAIGDEEDEPDRAAKSEVDQLVRYAREETSLAEEERLWEEALIDEQP